MEQDRMRKEEGKKERKKGERRRIRKVGGKGRKRGEKKEGGQGERKMAGRRKDSLHSIAIQFSSVTQSCPTLCDTMDCRMPGSPVHHQLLELAQTHVHRVCDAIQPSHPLSSPSPPAFNLSQHQSFPMTPFFASGGQSIGASASASVLSMNIQD